MFNRRYLLSHCSKEFLSQARSIFAATENSRPFNVDAWERILVDEYFFAGTWLPRHEEDSYPIGTVSYYGANIIVFDALPDKKLTRLLRALGLNGFSSLGGYERRAATEYLICKDMLMDYLAIEKQAIDRECHGISFYEWQRLHRRATSVGAFDIAEIAFKYLLQLRVSPSVFNKINQEHWDTYLKTMVNWLTDDNGEVEDDVQF